VEYSREVQARAAVELLLLSEQSAIVEMMVDYTVMRDQARGCARLSVMRNAFIYKNFNQTETDLA